MTVGVVVLTATAARLRRLFRIVIAQIEVTLSRRLIEIALLTLLLLARRLIEIALTGLLRGALVGLIPQRRCGHRVAIIHELVLIVAIELVVAARALFVEA